MKKFLILIIVLVAGYFALNKFYPQFLQKILFLKNQSSNEIANWKTLSVEPGPGIKFEIQHPSNWDASELRFPCKNINDMYLAAISPVRTDLKGYEGVSVAYLVQFCVRNEASLLFQGFIKAPLSVQPSEQDKIVIPEDYLKTTDEYKIAKQIISTLNISKTTYPNFNQ